jgi:ribonuclease HI
LANKSVNIYTDGACAGNQHEVNRGGWGAILEYGPHRKEICGGEHNTTNNRMEMMALIAALSALTREGLRVNIFSDSSYVMNCLRDRWYLSWQRNGWKNAKKEPVENRDLWEKLIAFLPRHDFRYYRIKGHLNLQAKESTLRTAYQKFKLNNGDGFSFADFQKIAKENNRADELANIGISKLESPTTSPR